MDNVKNTLLEPVVSNNPIALQILGICSALAVTSSLKVSFVMCVALTCVRLLQLICFFNKALYSWEYSNHRSNDYYRLSGDCCRSGT
jgi:Na+-transporting NADH:ubiquinone oxidoreductase subunit NqrD